MKINWDKYFDHIFVLSRCSNFERRENLNQELKRIGLYDYVTYLYQPDSELLDYKSSNLQKSQYRCKYAHYSCIKMAYELGYDHICILEDDMIFLKDISEIEKQLDLFLENRTNSDIYLFDYIINDNPSITLIKTYYLADFYYINRHGMEFLIYLIENYPNIMNDSLLTPSLFENNLFQFYLYISRNTNPVYIDLTKPNLLPININISETRICIQKDSIQYDIFKNQIDKTLYNNL